MGMRRDEGGEKMMLKNRFLSWQHRCATHLDTGALPGDPCLKENQYYEHPRNTFWKIMGEFFPSIVEQGGAVRVQITLRQRDG